MQVKAEPRDGHHDRDMASHGNDSHEHRRKRTKRTGGKACVYCRRSHMVCEGGRPCERCIKRDIAQLCRDVTPTPRRASETSQTRTVSPQPAENRSTEVTDPSQPLPTSLYADANFPPGWPLLPDTSGPVTYSNGTNNNSTGSNGGMWGNGEETELAALTKFMGDLSAPAIPGTFLDVISYLSRGGTIAGSAIPSVNTKDPSTNATPLFSDTPLAGPSSSETKLETGTANGTATENGKGKQKETPGQAYPQLRDISRIERYFLAAADQPTGPRASRLAQVIKAKYDAGLLKPYDYIKGYERMNKWMESGRAAPKAESDAQGSQTSSPRGGAAGRGRVISATPTPVPLYGNSISPESRRRILTALNGFRPKFRQIARTLTDVDLVFVEEAMERWMLEYDRLFASIHTPSCIWRRTGEIQKANQEFANITGIPASMFRGGILCVYELMDEDSAVRYWEGYAKIAFDAGQRSLTTTCTLKIPLSLTKSIIPKGATVTPAGGIARTLPGSGGTDIGKRASILMTRERSGGGAASSGVSDSGYGQEEFRIIKCCFSVTIRRDAWGVPVAIMGQWIPM